MKETQRQCKVKDCTGNIVATGEVWPMANNRYFHKCNKCGFETTVTGKMFGIHGVFTFPEMGKKIEKARARIEKSNSKTSNI